LPARWCWRATRRSSSKCRNTSTSANFAKQLVQRLPTNAKVKTAATAVLTALKGGFVLQNAIAGAALNRATGVSIYFPNQADYSPDYRDLAFSKEGRWRKFLEALFHL